MGRLRPVPAQSADFATSRACREELGSSRAVKVHHLRHWRRTVVGESLPTRRAACSAGWGD
ncbi:unnamed protein product, partial [Ilex paraguariensis]